MRTFRAKLVVDENQTQRKGSTKGVSGVFTQISVDSATGRREGVFNSVVDGNEFVLSVSDHRTYPNLYILEELSRGNVELTVG